MEEVSIQILETITKINSSGTYTSQEVSTTFLLFLEMQLHKSGERHFRTN